METVEQEDDRRGHRGEVPFVNISGVNVLSRSDEVLSLLVRPLLVPALHSPVEVVLGDSRGHHYPDMGRRFTSD